MDSVYHGDSLELMLKIPPNLIDLVIADPPFGIGYSSALATHGLRMDVLKDKNVLEYHEIPTNEYPEFTSEWITKAYRILKETGSMYVFSGWNNLEYVLTSLRRVGFFTQSHVIWKYRFPSWTSRRFASSHYHVIHVTKHKSKYTFNRVENYPQDVWSIDREFWSRHTKKTGTKLPRKLVSKIVRFSSNKQDVVFDPFLGSGTSAVAAKRLNRHFLGFEIMEQTYQFAKQRIEKTRWGTGVTDLKIPYDQWFQEVT